jgi:peptide-methionine (S)-S-oxide reductase
MSLTPARSLILAAALAGTALAAPAAWAQSAGAPAVATFAGGCFWSIEKAFDGKPGVLSAVSGFMGGTTKNPTYKQVVGGDTGHLEAVQVTYDPAKISYDKLLDIFWHDIDPTTADGQFCDFGEQYHTAVFIDGDAQKRAAEATRSAVSAELGKKVMTDVRPASEFTPAGPEHQDFAHKNPGHYNAYLAGCGREAKLKSVWGAKAHAKL